MTKITLLVASATLLFTACGDSGGGGSTNAVTEGQAEPYCNQGCTYELDCDPTADPVETCVAECLDDVVGVIREDVFIDITNCSTGLDCAASDDECFGECAPTDSHNAYETACREALGACDLSAADIDGVCEVTPNPTTEDGFFCLLAPSIVDQLTECFADGTCQDYSTCLQATLEENGVNF